MTTGRRRWLGALVGITALGLAIRLWGVDAHGVWYDEAYYGLVAQSDSIGHVLRTIAAVPPSAPLYAVLLSGWVAIAGSGDVALRLPSVIAGTLVVPAAAWLAVEAVEAVGRRGVALIAALFVAVSPVLVQMSQEARPYALGALSLTLALAAGLRWRRTSDRRWAVAYALAGAVALYAHYLSAGVLALMAILGALHWSGTSGVSRGRWLAVSAASFLLWSPWLVAMVLQLGESSVLRTSFPAGDALPSLVNALVEATAGHVASLRGIRPLEIAGLGLGALLLASGWRASTDDRSRSLRVLLVAAGAVVLIPAAASAVTGTWLFAAPFVSLVLPVALVAMATGVGWLASGGDRGRLAAIGLTAAWLLVQVAGLTLDRSGRWHADDQYRDVATLIGPQRAPDEGLLVTPPLLEPGFAHYIDDVRGLPEPFDPSEPYRRPDPAAWQPAMRDALNEMGAASGVWLAYRPDMDPGGILIAGLRERFPTSQLWTYDAWDLYHFTTR